MTYTFNGATKRIVLSTGTTAVDLEDLYSRWKDWVLTSDNSKYLQAFRTVGKDPDGEGGFTGSYIFIMNGWSITPQSASHTLTLNGNLFRDADDLSGEPLVQTVPTYTINIILARSSLAQGIDTGGGGFTSSDRSVLAAIQEIAQDLRDLRGWTASNPMTADESAGTITTSNGKQVTVSGSGTTRVYTRTS